MNDTRRRTWILVPAIAIAAMVLAVVTYRTTFKIDALRAESIFAVTLGLADEKVDRVERAIIESDDALMNLGENVAPDDLPRRWRSVLARQTPTISRIAVIDQTGPPRIVAFAARSVDPNVDEAFKQMLTARIVPDLDLATLPLNELKHLHKAYDGTFQLIAYWRAPLAKPDEHGSTERVVIIEHDLAVIEDDLLSQIIREPESGSSRADIVDDSGKIVFGEPLAPSDFVVQRPFPTTLYAWRLQIASPQEADELASQTRRRRLTEMALVGLSLLVVLAGSVAMLIATAQERRLNATRSEFVANVSHELKTPLALVRMFGELLKSGRVASEEKRDEYLSIIVRESERLTALIENVLDFARVERGKASYDFDETDVGVVVARAVEACRYRAEMEGMRLEVTIAPELPNVRLDERALQLAVINLVENAIKYAPKTELVKIEVAKEGTLGASDAVAIRVIDRGPGIPDDERPRIFERFYRGKGAREGNVRGSGIGLALVQHIVEVHEGDIRVERGEGGVGTTFIIRLPVIGPTSSVRV